VTGFSGFTAGYGVENKVQVESRTDVEIMATVAEETQNAGIEEGGVRRRDFINIATVAWAGVGAGAIVLPLINQMNPSADVLAEASIEVNLAAIEAGQSIKTIFRKQPLFVRHLTPAEISAAEAVPVGSLRDPETLEQRTKETVDGHNGRVHPSRLRSTGCRKWRDQGRIWRLFLPLPRIKL
jgi:hypothetical protein